MKNQITFYVPTLNSQETIKECLESILATTANVTVIDGGSSDDTVNIVKSLEVKIHKKKSKNLANARNIAIKNCKTKYIVFVDSDCVLDKRWLSLIMKNFSDNVAGVGGKLKEKYTKSLADKWRAFHLKQHFGSKKIKNPEFLFGSNCVFDIKFLRKIGGYNEKYKTNYEDVDISKRLRQNGYDLVYEPKAICYHLKRDNLISILKVARRWSFYSYDIPDTFSKLLKRLFVFNPHLFLSQISKDTKCFNFSLIFVTFSSFMYNQYYDVKYYCRKNA